jgi:hypothetical protein
MNTLANILSSITKDIYSSKDNNSYHRFFYSSMLHYAISLEIASSSYNDKLLSFEKLCLKIPKKLGCRSSIKNILDHGIEKNIFIKVSVEKDKRIKQYKLSESYSLMITNWYLIRKKRYAS